MPHYEFNAVPYKFGIAVSGTSHNLVRIPYHADLNTARYLCPILLNPLAYTAACEAAGFARSINTQPAVRRNSETNPTSQHNRGMYLSQ